MQFCFMEAELDQEEQEGEMRRELDRRALGGRK